MNCKHKFHQHLDLSYVDYPVRHLFIGTFNPGCCQEGDNSAQWFYGRTQKNMLWDTLGFILENNPNLGKDGNPDKWQRFLRKNGLAMTDLISEIQNVDVGQKDIYDDLCKNFSDKKLEPYIEVNNITATSIVELIENHSSLKSLQSIYLTRRTANSPWDKLWNPIREIGLKNGIAVKTLVTPGGFNYFQFNNEFKRTPENLAKIWQENNQLHF